ncbi:hypothetical protein GGR52DRAFT_535183 [Hypoxylon sp. FL1284]|nr:hypothetical protein GGR52DRAFT_535183 [Hypoxylon sp. FL1284]
MASPSSTSLQDTVISLKVNCDGVNRRFKLPLRELVISTLEDKLRAFLQIPAGTPATLERYSDSAASYVVLNSQNMSAYKQLYRAAKAKHKLKLRVTTQPQPEPEPELLPEPEPEPELVSAPASVPEIKSDEVQVPKPVTVEDEAEAELKETPNIPTQIPSPDATTLTGTPDAAPAGTIVSLAVSEVHGDLTNFIKMWRGHGMPAIHLRQDDNGTEVVDLIGSTSEAKPLASEPVSETPNSGEHERTQNTSLAPLGDVVDFMRADREVHGGISPEGAAAALNGAFGKQVSDILNVTSSPKSPFTVCCNSCDQAIPDAHFHCSTCDDGDFDLCQGCVNQGITCYDDSHWMIKRHVKDGQITNSTTHVAPKSKRAHALDAVSPPTRSWPIGVHWDALRSDRTCNCCVQDFTGDQFVHCTVCEDYDLCKNCFAKDKHGHHPGHAFVAAVKGTVFDYAVSSRLSAGRNASHNAICDGCDKYVRGIRHKCLDCPDWDYCSDCVKDAAFIHPNHRFVEIYSSLATRSASATPRSVHHGICCDGPLCSSSRSGTAYIVGVRYKCAVCHDTDFCANCEASPSNTHNKTHPLIKFKTPIRHVNVTTTGEHEDGQQLPLMGDRVVQTNHARASGAATSTHEDIAATPVQTVVDVHPVEPKPTETTEREVKVKEEASDGETTTLVEKQPSEAELRAVFLRDRVADGTVLPPNHTFTQEWVLRNEGETAWPAGCSVKFVGGDYMGAVDPTHPAGIHELVSASESTICYNALQPGQEFPFTVLMRTPDRQGKVISYWRLTTSDGVKFGHKLWCDVTVQAPATKVRAEREGEDDEATDPAPEVAESQMIIPKLEHESPSSSMHGAVQSEGQTETETETETETTGTVMQSAHDSEDDDFEDCGQDEEWADSDDGFMTDEEYDILDASDEEYLSEQHKTTSKK